MTHCSVENDCICYSLQYTIHYTQHRTHIKAELWKRFSWKKRRKIGIFITYFLFVRFVFLPFIAEHFHWLPLYCWKWMIHFPVCRGYEKEKKTYKYIFVNRKKKKRVYKRRRKFYFPSFLCQTEDFSTKILMRPLGIC